MTRTGAILTVILAVATLAVATEPPRHADVYRAGDGGFAAIRIPSLVVTPGGALLAFAEGRRAPQADQAGNAIVLRRSTDGGASWGALTVVAADSPHSLNNPTSVVDQRTGTILLVYQRIPGHLKEMSAAIETGYEGPNVFRTYLRTSTDDGRTWSAPREITRGTKRPRGATTVCSGPGAGIQLTRGPYAGRILLPFNEGPFWEWNNYAAWSDDSGLTWRYGANVPGVMVRDKEGRNRSQVNEVQFVELADGSIRLNSRRFAGAPVRKTSLSRDGGASWSNVEDVPELRDPSCMASIVRVSFPSGDARGRVLFSGPDAADRTRGTIHVSYDDGKSWPVARVLEAGSFAYSVLAPLPDGSIGCLYETDGTDRMVFARFTIPWVEEDAPSGPH